tara:strand:+ start:377 stop:613 length:237 start_codon:yes stop_codon:yes gene_type:complete
MTFHHMSVTKQEAQFLKSILVKHLEDYVEELVREDNTNDAMLHMQQNREAGKTLLSKAEAAIRRASRAASDPHFTNLS